MSNAIVLNERSSKQSGSQIRGLRNSGHIPATVYGKDIGSVSVMVEEKLFLATIKENPRAILMADIPQKGKKPVTIQHIQKDPITRKIMHIDFHQLNMNVTMDTKVTIHFSGEPIGVYEGGVMQVELYEVEVRCMPDDLLSAFEVDITKIGIGDHLLVSDLEFHKGIEVLTDPTAVVIKVSAAIEAELEDESAEATPVVPEVDKPTA